MLGFYKNRKVIVVRHICTFSGLFSFWPLWEGRANPLSSKNGGCVFQKLEFNLSWSTETFMLFTLSINSITRSYTTQKYGELRGNGSYRVKEKLATWTLSNNKSKIVVYWKWPSFGNHEEVIVLSGIMKKGHISGFVQNGNKMEKKNIVGGIKYQDWFWLVLILQ